MSNADAAERTPYKCFCFFAVDAVVVGSKINKKTLGNSQISEYNIGRRKKLYQRRIEWTR